MKLILTLSSLLLIISNLFAQADTIITNSGKVYPCTILEFDDERIVTLDGNGEKLNVHHLLIKNVILENHGEIFTKKDGFTKDIELLTPFLERRILITKEEKEFSENLKKQKRVNTVEFSPSSNYTGNEWCRPKFSFGIFYVPNIKSNQNIQYSQNSIYYTIVEYNHSLIESQFSYNLTRRLFTTFNVAYNSAYMRHKFVRQEVSTNPVNINNDGNEYENSLKQFSLEIGVKYYLMDMANNKVSAYLLAGIGKTFAWSSSESKNLFPTDPQNYTETSNRDEYVEDMNSPFLFQAGFGAEYFFNNYLSVHSSIRLYYTTTSAELTENFSSNTMKRNSKTERDQSEFETRVGLGLNFYF